MEAVGLVSNRQDISVLVPEPTADKFKELSSQFSSMRKVRGDGNCFYRALCFSHLESLLHRPTDLHRFKEKILQSSHVFMAAGFEEKSYKRHLDTLMRLVQRCQGDTGGHELLELFNEQATSDGSVQYLRLLTSAHLQIHNEDFCSFVEAPSLQVYCYQVEAMAMESDHVDILALTQALDVCVHIVSLDSDEHRLIHHIIPEGATPSLCLLYQESHYDILYRRADAPLPAEEPTNTC